MDNFVEYTGKSNKKLTKGFHYFVSVYRLPFIKLAIIEGIQTNTIKLYINDLEIISDWRIG